MLFSFWFYEKLCPNGLFQAGRVSRLEVARIEEVPAGRVKLVRAHGLELILCRAGDHFRAYRNVCPHANAPLHTGRVTDGTLRCPWHGWEFDLETGRHVLQPACTLDAYPVEVEGDRLFVTA